jgi:anthranilate synthase component 1
MTGQCHITELTGLELPELYLFHQFNPQRYPFLLASTSKRTAGAVNQTAASLSHYDILFIDADEWIMLDDQQLMYSSANVSVERDKPFLENFDDWFAKDSSISDNPQCSHLPFTGGWFIFLAYEIAQQVEPSLQLVIEPQVLPVAYAARVRQALIVDHEREQSWLVSEPEVAHEQALTRLKDDLQQIELNSNDTGLAIKDLRQLLQHLNEDEDLQFLNSVADVKQYIKDGDVFQVNLSRLWQSTFPGDSHHSKLSSLLFSSLSKTNPAPFAGLCRFNTQKGLASIISSSPERLLKSDNNRLDSRPIAGTRPRSAVRDKDERLMNELHQHPKEQAEHIMLIDLIRNDLGRVCKPGSVKVDELMVNESYAHVHHIVSNVTGLKQIDKTPGEVIKAMFPGGTITGCPKVRCMEIIAELENCSRGAYTGSMGYINLDGSMDLNILIRTMVLEENFSAQAQSQHPQSQKHLSFRAGAGLVYDSIADKELHETRAKAKGLLKALQGIE